MGVTLRQHSPIIGLKNFNNWVKSVLIARFAHPVLRADESKDRRASRGNGNDVQRFQGGGGKVLDMGCGKGGDLNKWQKAKVKFYVGVGGQNPLLFPGIRAYSVLRHRGRFN